MTKTLQSILTLFALFSAMLSGSVLLAAQEPVQRPGNDSSNQDSQDNGKSKRPILVNHDPVAIAANELAPEWVRKGAFVEDGVQYVVVHTDGMNTRHDAFEAIQPAMEKAALKQIDNWIGKPGSSQRIQLSPDFLRENVVVAVPPAQGEKPEPRYEVHEFKSKYSPEFAKQLGQEYGDFFCGYAQLRFDEEFKAHILAEWDQVLTQNRLLLTACIGAGFLGLLAVLFGYLRLNHMTRGFYHGRLQTAAIIAALTVVTVCIVAVAYLQLT